MSRAASVKPTHRVIEQYYEAMREYKEQNVTHELAVRSAFQNLLGETARSHGWFLVPEETLRVGGKSVTADGTLRDEYRQRRGYWEAKDTDDKLDAEIRKKVRRGYPLNNTIFEDTRQVQEYTRSGNGRRNKNGEPDGSFDLFDNTN